MDVKKKPEEKRLVFIMKMDFFFLMSHLSRKWHANNNYHANKVTMHILLAQLIGSDSSDKHHLELPVLMYNEILSGGWCENVPVLIHSDQLLVVEKGLLAMRVLSGTCGFSRESARLKELVKQLEDGAEAELDTEYTNQLLELCRTLLKYIRSQNLDL